ncbi:MAG: hypothetical protein GY817_02235 [bacterium]|nr:hypothetical protein [bacterium]
MNKIIKILDLHGKRHEEVENEVENFVLLNPCPLTIVTGNSLRMQEMVKRILNKYNLRYSYSSDLNLGSLFVTDY